MPQAAKVAQTVEPAAPQSRVTDTEQENTSSESHARFQALMEGMNDPQNGSRASINHVVQRLAAGGQHPLQRHEDFMYLQRTIGNQAVIQLLDEMGRTPRGDINKTAAAGGRVTVNEGTSSCLEAQGSGTTSQPMRLPASSVNSSPVRTCPRTLMYVGTHPKTEMHLLANPARVIQRIVDDSAWEQLVKSFWHDLGFISSLQKYLTENGYPPDNVKIRKLLVNERNGIIREHVDTQWTKWVSEATPELAVNTEAEAAHDIVRMVLGIPVNASIKTVCEAQLYTAEAGALANNLRNDVATKLGVENAQKYDSDPKVKLQWMVRNAAVGLVIGGGVCNDFGALSAILLHLGGIVGAKFVGDDGHNWAEYDDGHPLDPWKRLRHKEEKISSTRRTVIVDLALYSKKEIFDMLSHYYAEAERIRNELILTDANRTLADYIGSPAFKESRFLGSVLMNLIPDILLAG